MPYNDYGQEIPSRANLKTGFITFGDIGGIGQLIYHNFRFADYTLEFDDRGRIIATPVISRDNPPDMSQMEGLDGNKILISLCDLARQVDSYETKEAYQDLIIEWCRTYMHPYRIDELFDGLTEIGTDASDFLLEVTARDAVFCIDDFMHELGQLYNAARFYFALDGVTVAKEAAAYDLYEKGKFFESSALFEKYKVAHPELPEDFDLSAAGGDLLKEMQMTNAYLATHPVKQPPEGEFAAEPYDDYEKLRDALLGFFPDFKLRLKAHPKTKRIMLSADVNSVFEIAWYALAHLLTEEPLPEEKGKEMPRPEGMMTFCKNCGRFYVRRNSRNEYCDRDECQRARNAKNQREYRDRKRIKKARNNRT